MNIFIKKTTEKRVMKPGARILIYTVIAIFCSSSIDAKINSFKCSYGLYFIENKGQIADQSGHRRDDVQFALSSAGMNIFIGDGQLHYQFSHVETCDGYMPQQMWMCDNATNKGIPETGMPRTVASYRMDVELVGANKHAKIVCQAPLAYYENYYLPGCPANGIQAHTFGRITYKNVYPGIDWVFYTNGGKLEHEFVVGPGGDASQIRLKYSGQSSLKINGDGSIVATTPMGTIREHAPVCYAKDGSKISAGYQLQGDLLSYRLDDHNSSLVIDPIVEWGTYYGADTSSSPAYDVAIDDSGFIYMTGMTYCATTGSIATAGSYQETMIGTPDAYIVKFDSAGNRIWGTYYGGVNGSWGNGVACNHFGGIFIAGTTASKTNIATTGIQQPVYGGGEWDGFLAKFNSAGQRQWCTYVGGGGADEPSAVCCDFYGHVYISGFTNSSDGIATSGGFMPSQPAGGEVVFLDQYDTAGVRHWGTYYGGESSQFGGTSCSDGYNVYLTAWTESATGISSPGCYQPALNGPADAFVVKFDGTGARLWATYFGGESTEQTGGITCDDAGQLYLLGTTYSNTGIATPGCAQPTSGGGADAFLTMIDKATGFPIWGTYYGGPGDELTGLSRISSFGSQTYITGITLSLSGLASAGAWQTTFGGGDEDAFLAAYDMTGKQLWSTYVGGDGTDEARAVAANPGGIYVTGQTGSTDNIGTPGSFLPTGGAGGIHYDYQAFLLKFIYPPNIALSTAHVNNTPTEQVLIYPTPNKGTFTLTGKFEGTDGSVHVIVTDMEGRIVLSDEAPLRNGVVSKIVRLNDDVPAGAYILKAVSNQQVGIAKFVKE